MSSHFKITAYNAEALYVWGTEADAGRYVDWLNRDREINFYSAEAIPESEWGSFEDRSDVMSMEEPYWDDFMEEGEA